MSGKAAALAWCAAWAALPTGAAELGAGWSLEGSVGVEARLFAQSPADPAQARDTAALLLNPTLKGSFGAERAWEAVLTPYARVDARDHGSRYVDLREAALKYRDNTQHFRVGFDIVFWGVMESNHLIDVVNQVDPRADVDLEAKLGQPMVSYTRFLDRFGRVEAFWLPYFRARPGVGVKSRQRLDPAPESQQTHGLGKLRRHDDWALRWSGQIGDLDLGLYHFRGLGREPDTSANPEGAYRPIRQTGINLQLPQGSMMWKLEALRRSGQGRPFSAWSAGGEYTISYPSGDLGLILEWSRDYRDETAPPTRFAKAAFTGVRYRLNESGDSELLCGALRDLRHYAWMYKCEFSRRLSDHVKLGLIARKISAGADSVYAPLRRDGNLQVTLSYNF